MVRLERGAVVLDARGRTIVELREDGARALDLLFDRVGTLPATEDEAMRVRRVFRALRRELLGESGARPDRPLDFALDAADTLLRRYGEPPRWGSSNRKEDGASSGGPTIGVALLRGGSGLLGLCGAQGLVARVASAFRAAGADELAAEEATVRYDGTALLELRPSRERVRPVEMWSVEMGARDGLTLARLAPERALVKLLAVTRARPSEADLSALALYAERVPHFSAVVPRDFTALARVVAEYASSSLR